MPQDHVLLVILDGWGHGPNPKVSAIAQANTPVVDALYQKYPNSELTTYGQEVGLPEGQMGNSEVGHLNIGAGRIVYQELARINKAIREKTLHQHEALLNQLKKAKTNNKAFHIMGLVSDGGVHSHINHLKAIIDIAEEHGPEKIFIHAFTDGRDVDPKSGKGFIADLCDYVKDKRTNIFSVIGRYYAMDRDNRWDRIKLAYNLITEGKGKASSDPPNTIQEFYDQDITDEFLPAIIHGNTSDALKDGDTLFCFNFRTDRPRQISKALTQEDFPEHSMKKLSLDYLTMTQYDESFKNITVLFQKDNIQQTLGETLSKAGMTQVRIAETEKYPHVTFFFNGGREDTFEGEKRILIPSPKVATYDLKPEMSAIEITDAIVQEININQPNFICLNYANTDMVGHTGDFKAAIKAAETVDTCLGILLDAALKQHYASIIIADHGNSDFMINEDGSPHTAHTLNPVPCIYVSDNDILKINNGKLADIAPSILEILGLEKPSLMDGESLLQS